MYEENRRFSWTSFFIKVIIIIIFILFTVWLLSLTTKGLSSSLNILKDDIFSQNVEKMKEVGKEYFTTERLPEKVGEVKTLTLAKMYDQNLILEIKDKNGYSCSAKNSYVSVEKLEDEYQMKVYLSCGEEEDYIVVIMGCYNYCKTDICEQKKTTDDDTKETDKKEDDDSKGTTYPENNDTSKGTTYPENNDTTKSAIEYQYKKTTGGRWSDWSSWSNWSKTSVSNTDSRSVETKLVDEEYTIDKEITKTVYTSEATCPNVSGYTFASKTGNTCKYTMNTSDTQNPVCPDVYGYKNTGRNGFDCTYTKSDTKTQDPTCPDVSGYKNTGRNGFTCSYSKTTDIESTVNPTCPTVSGFKNTGRNGFTCSYSRTTNVSSTLSPTCPNVSGYNKNGRSGFTCYYKKTTYSTSWKYYSTGSGSYVPANTSTYKYVQTAANYVYKCNNSCKYQWVYTYTIYKKSTTTSTSTKTASAYCSSGTRSGNTCVVTTPKTETKTATAQCPSGTRSGNTCVVTTPKTETKTETAKCLVGTRSGDTCIDQVTDNIKRTASCNTANGYVQSGDTCVKKGTASTTRIASCPSGENNIDGKCYKDVTEIIKEKHYRKVTYYRYRTRQYISGTVSYKWGSSKNDSYLINQGYKLTGVTR